MDINIATLVRDIKDAIDALSGGVIYPDLVNAIDQLAALTSPAKVGGDERDVVERIARAMNIATDGHDRYWSGYVKSAEAAYRAALSADGGETLGQKKAAFLKHEGAVETGVMLRAENRIALVTHQGRVEWYDANEFGGIQLSAEGGEDSGRFPALTELLAAHASELESNAYAYFELAYTRHTEWMAWICSNSRESVPGRKVIAHGQGATPEEACRAAIAAKLAEE